MYGAEYWTMRKKEEDLIVGVSKKEKIWNIEFKRRYGIEDIVEKVREARLR